MTRCVSHAMAHVGQQENYLQCWFILKVSVTSVETNEALLSAETANYCLWLLIFQKHASITVLRVNQTASHSPGLAGCPIILSKQRPPYRRAS